MRKFNRLVSKCEIIVGVIMTASIVLLVFLAAVTRAVGYPIVWSVDMAQLLFVWISMIGADLALKYKSHIGVDLLVRKMPVKVQNLVTLLTYLIIAGFIGFVIYWGITLCIDNLLRQYQTLQISYSYSTAAVPFVGALMLITLAENIVDLIKNWDKPSVSCSEQVAEIAQAKE